MKPPRVSIELEPGLFEGHIITFSSVKLEGWPLRQQPALKRVFLKVAKELTLRCSNACHSLWHLVRSKNDTTVDPQPKHRSSTAMLMTNSTSRLKTVQYPSRRSTVRRIEGVTTFFLNVTSFKSVFRYLSAHPTLLVLWFCSIGVIFEWTRFCHGSSWSCTELFYLFPQGQRYPQWYYLAIFTFNIRIILADCFHRDNPFGTSRSHWNALHSHPLKSSWIVAKFLLYGGLYKIYSNSNFVYKI